MLRKALDAVRAGRRDEAAKAALAALDVDETSAAAWHILGVCREKSGDFTGALQAYEAALGFSPDEPELASDLARLALKMGMPSVAEGLLRSYLARRPGSPDALNNLGVAQRDQMKFAAAIETLRGAIQANPDNAMLWNTLASVLTLQGQTGQALVFYDEALRLDPGFAGALYNRAMARLAAGLTEGVIADFDAAIAGAPANEAGAMRVARAWALLALGDLAEGWAAYAARHDPAYEDAVHFTIEAPAWRDDLDLAGRTLLMVGEQGVGDEILFAQPLPELIGELGPDGRLILAVEPRLASLFARSFPQAEVGAHASFKVDHHNARTVPFLKDRLGEIDVWATMGQPLARLRRTPEAFRPGAFLKADPARVAHWRAMLAGAGPGRKVGVLWRSLVMDAERVRYFAPFEAWAPVLATPGVTFVNLQYGVGAVPGLWTPPGLDLKDDLDDVAALCGALDLVIGPSNVTTNLAGATGAALWLITQRGAWTQLGTDAYPWYHQARVFNPPQLDQWPQAMAEIAVALREWL
ncbi:tetratricopeptide repeat protein [Phenylobacterium sp.]|uniref:tetratricopeptide repeat protein n=1 Tax=Phenylobacterium sp. TaxID=1871053 RepID=UPI002735430F|nr:tetratricopeptide repeat protein [Phenylobacterium sp.]MDP3854467.1 tetratricopeptide repeat protein [Phenylobacterium sp.]